MTKLDKNKNRCDVVMVIHSVNHLRERKKNETFVVSLFYLCVFQLVIGGRQNVAFYLLTCRIMS